MNIYEYIKTEVSQWKSTNYASDYVAIAEILEWQVLNGKNGSSALRYLRKPQLEALETYWYLRLVKGTPHIFDLYNTLISDSYNRLLALGVPVGHEKIQRLLAQGGAELVIEKIKTDDEFVRQYRLYAARETIALRYPSYILALAMGAGKTVLIGSIIATEFAMAHEYPDGPFVKNALVFAPGKTILGALKELSSVPFDKILPQRLYKQFISTIKFTYTRDGQKNIPVIPGSPFNVIVTNTEKIRITKQSITKGLLGEMFFTGRDEEEVKEDVANQRLKTIASLPNLAIFSDEAHHTYGQALDSELKQVRKTVDYLAQNTDVKVVVNTTGTPYYRRQTLKDVVYWYGLSQGIKDGILKEVRGNIMAFPKLDFKQIVRQVFKDFFAAM
ncbi:DEAD/DEAH box helicase family protein [Candidatus Methylacidiphilum infernorum]|uniref:DEAD/DEAH box helicase family protein n=1 Tax=Candidatus Methylacidiphilum infernorum TaxID=511746 RepID=A0ABX7PVD2_9BACT|nr:DEAD/DEAH box helicase family protein [Candidatus Methylacidiphilum infernorum]QSR86959.1 DEAD/DEAH box helicase family protein [Candidatus Methylacidiphilum infernorum]